jgi:hypothetical protein
MPNCTASAAASQSRTLQASTATHPVPLNRSQPNLTIHSNTKFGNSFCARPLEIMSFRRVLGQCYCVIRQGDGPFPLQVQMDHVVLKGVGVAAD